MGRPQVDFTTWNIWPHAFIASWFSNRKKFFGVVDALSYSSYNFYLCDIKIRTKIYFRSIKSKKKESFSSIKNLLDHKRRHSAFVAGLFPVASNWNFRTLNICKPETAIAKLMTIFIPAGNIICERTRFGFGWFHWWTNFELYSKLASSLRYVKKNCCGYRHGIIIN